MNDKLYFDSPADYFEEACPIGNGSMGAMIYGRNGSERISFNHDTFSSQVEHTVTHDNSSLIMTGHAPYYHDEKNQWSQLPEFFSSYQEGRGISYTLMTYPETDGKVISCTLTSPIAQSVIVNYNSTSLRVELKKNTSYSI